MIKIGIECEQIEEESWGVGRIISGFLQEVANRPELQDKYEFHLFFKSKIPDYPYLNSPIFHKEIIWQPSSRHSFVLYYYVFLPIRLWFKKIDVMFFPNYMLPIIYFGKSIVMMTEDIYHEMRSKDQSFHHRLAYRIFGYWSVWFATKIMAISESSKKELTKLFKINFNRIFINYPGINKPINYRRETMARQKSVTLGYSLSSISYALFIGQMFPRRSVKEIILAFEKIANEYPDLKLILIGRDKYRPQIIDNLIKNINIKLGQERIMHYDYVEDEELAELYQNAKAFVYVSSAEAFGFPPVEAAGYGTPIIVKNCDLNRELFGDSAIFVKDEKNINEIAEAMKKGLESEKNPHLAEKIKGNFTWKNFTDIFLKELPEL